MKIQAKEKKERALSTKLFLKAERCNSPKCAMTRHPHRPGAHGGKPRRQLSELGRQWHEHQKIRFIYGITAVQLKRVVQIAARAATATGEKIIELLERRLDNAVYRLGLAPSRLVARQMVSHGHIFVNGQRISIPSYEVKVGDHVTIRPQSRQLKGFQALSERFAQYEPPQWLTVDKEAFEGTVVALPRDVEMPFDLNLVVDYYSK